MTGVARVYRTLERQARKQIRDYGKPATVLLKQVSDPDRPWDAGQEPPGELSVKLVEARSLERYKDRSTVQQGDRFGIISTEGAGSGDITLGRAIVIDGQELKLMGVDPVNPGGRTVIYEFWARQ